MLNSLFKNNFQSFSERPALTYKDKVYSYKELNQRSNQFAHYLKSKSINNGTIVALLSRNYLERIVSILALWKLGAAYLPIDPNYPEARIDFILHDARINFMITDEEIYKKTDLNTDCKYILLDSKDNESNNFPIDELPYFKDKNTLAYIAYTSGSTGNPKGVMVTHGNIFSIYNAWKQIYNLTYEDRHLQIANFGFDVCSGDIIRAFGSGAHLVICPAEIILNPEKLFNLLNKEVITVAEFTPIVLRKLISYLYEERLDLHFMRLLICGSDAWSVKEYKDFKSYLSPNARLINSYGTTETAIDSTYFELNEPISQLNELSSVPLGKPFPNSIIKILNEELKECPPGIQGEIYIGGEGVSLGYLNQPELTQKKFISFLLNKRNEIFYKTGDLGYYLTDGNIIFLGRSDDQIKIMGFRVDLLEVENILNTYHTIEKAVILSHSSFNSTAQFLVAFIKHDKTFKINDYIDYLKTHLPSYSIPLVYFPINSFPVSPHGKVDRARLGAHLILSEQNNNFNNEFHKGLRIENDIENKIVAILRRLFNISSFDLNNFFYINTDFLLNKLQEELKFSDIKFDLSKYISIHTIHTIYDIKKLLLSLS